MLAVAQGIVNLAQGTLQQRLATACIDVITGSSAAHCWSIIFFFIFCALTTYTT